MKDNYSCIVVLIDIIYYRVPQGNTVDPTYFFTNVKVCSTGMVSSIDPKIYLML